MLSHIFPVEVGMILCPAHRCQCERLYEGGQCIITTTTTKNEQKKSVLFPCTNYTICRNNAIQKKKRGGGVKESISTIVIYSQIEIRNDTRYSLYTLFLSLHYSFFH